MAARDPRHPPSDPAAVPVPQLIEKYRVQREAWMAQADELARLRDEVRGSAEHEAMEIVTAARRDIRRIVMEARRELFVLSAQVQAALGEGGPGSPQLGPAVIAHDDDRDAADDDLSAFAQEEWGFAPRSTVAAVLEEARADMAVLDKDARAVPTGAPAAEAPDDPESIAAVPRPERQAGSLLAVPASSAAAEAHDRLSVRWSAVFVLAAFALVMGTVWVLRGSPDDAADAVPVVETAAAPSAPPAAAADTPGGTPAEDPTSVRLSIEAVRPAWIRATVDGQSGAGQTLRAGETYEFTGRSIALRVGDAGAVRVSVNGSEPQPLGRDGQVVNREYSLEPAAADESRTAPEPLAVPEEAGTGSVIAGPLPAIEPPLEATSSTPVLLAEASPAAVADGTSGASPPPAPAVERTRSDAPAPESSVIAAARRWLDAYQRQDQITLAVLSTPDAAVVDERPTGERMPIAIGGIARSLDRVNVRINADTAVLTGVMTERAVNGGLERSSPVSLVWVSSAGAWRLSQARIVSQSTLGQIFR